MLTITPPMWFYIYMEDVSILGKIKDFFLEVLRNYHYDNCNIHTYLTASNIFSRSLSSTLWLLEVKQDTTTCS
jgi:hypothetical protein